MHSNYRANYRTLVILKIILLTYTIVWTQTTYYNMFLIYLKMSVAFQVYKTVHTKTRNELEPPGTSWNQLERAGTRQSLQRLALERIMVVSCKGSC